MEVRIIRVKGPDRTGKPTTKYLVTTLLDPIQYPVEEIGSLYFHRWEIELRFRDIKTTMGMELIRILVAQIDGTIERRPQKGTSFLILFKGLGKDKLI